MSRPLDGRVAIVTGGGWNIGRVVALRLAKLGAAVVVASRTMDRLQSVVTEIESAGGQGLAVSCDVTKLEQTEALAAEALSRFGRIDIMVACAGGSGAHQSIEEVDPAVWYDVVAKNLHGTFHCARSVLPTFRANNAGHIITFAGGGAFFPILGESATAYASSKAAICRFMDQLQAELYQTGIRVNAVEPGMVWSEDTLAAVAAEEARTGQPHPQRGANRSPEDVADLVEFLTTEPGAGVRGRILSVNDDWWRNPESVQAVEQNLMMFRLRRHDGS